MGALFFGSSPMCGTRMKRALNLSGRWLVGRALGPHALSGEYPPAAGRPPPLFRLQGHGGPAPDPPASARKAWPPPAYRKPSPVAAGRLLGKVKEEAATRPGDICARGLPAATGPSRSRPPRAETPPYPNGPWTARLYAYRRAPSTTALETTRFPSIEEKHFFQPVVTTLTGCSVPRYAAIRPISGAAISTSKTKRPSRSDSKVRP